MLRQIVIKTVFNRTSDTTVHQVCVCFPLEWSNNASLHPAYICLYTNRSAVVDMTTDNVAPPVLVTSLQAPCQSPPKLSCPHSISLPFSRSLRLIDLEYKSQRQRGACLEGGDGMKKEGRIKHAQEKMERRWRKTVRRRGIATSISATPIIYLYSAETDEMISKAVTSVLTRTCTCNHLCEREQPCISFTM